MKLDDIEVGMSVAEEFAITDQVIDEFIAFSGDASERHRRPVDGIARVCHGAIIASYISSLIGMRLPGHSALLLSMNLNFRKKIYVGDAVVISVEVVQISEAVSTINLALRANVMGETRIKGEALVRVE